MPAIDAPVALVTGSRTGLGRHIAGELLKSGYQVFGCSRKPAEWSAEGYCHFTADVSREEQLKPVFEEIRKRCGRLDALVNNAGVASMNHSLVVPAETLDRIFSVNVRGAFLAAREAAKLMQKRRFGRIVNFSTIAVPMRLAGEAVYAASKGAVETLTRVLAVELAPFGITVNAVGPTPIDTDLIRNVPAEKMQALVDRLAIKRKGEPRDVMNVVEFFLKPESDAVTGQIIYLGGV